MDMMQIRRRVLSNAPHLETVSGKFANFKTDVPLNLAILIVNFGYRSGGWSGLPMKHCGVNLLQCDMFTDGTQKGFSYTGTRNSDGEITQIKINGTGTGSNCFRNLSYVAGNFRVFEGLTSTYGYSNTANVETVGDAAAFKNTRGRYPQDEPIAVATYWQDYDIDDQTYNSQHTNRNTATWYRIKIIPHDATGLSIDTTVYPMVCHTNDRGCAFEPYHGENLPVTFPATIYGGHIDLVSGILVSEYGSDGSLLPTPVLYQLTPMTVQAFNGVNNFYCTELGTTVTAKYWSH